MRTLLFIEGIFYLIMGVWPMVHYRSFAKVTGPKTDVWLVITVSWLINVCGAVMLFSAFRDEVPWETVVVALGAPLALGFIDVYYVFKKVISRVYLADAVIEAVFILVWLIFLSTDRAAVS